MSQASAQNEGKIHLGYVYANDRSLWTARTMVKGAIAFASLMWRWVGDAGVRFPSDAVLFVVHHGSLLSVEEIEQRFWRSYVIAMEESRSRRSIILRRRLSDAAGTIVRERMRECSSIGEEWPRLIAPQSSASIPRPWPR